MMQPSMRAAAVIARARRHNLQGRRRSRRLPSSGNRSFAVQSASESACMFLSRGSHCDRDNYIAASTGVHKVYWHSVHICGELMQDYTLHVGLPTATFGRRAASRAQRRALGNGRSLSRVGLRPSEGGNAASQKQALCQMSAGVHCCSMIWHFKTSALLRTDCEDTA